MIGYLHDHPAMQDRGPGGGGDHTTAINIDTPFTFATNAGRKNVEIADAKAEPLTPVRLLASLEYAAYFQTREAAQSGNASFTVEGAKWAISSENLAFEKNGENLHYDVTGKLTVTIDGVKYEVKSITYTGIDKTDVVSGRLTAYDDTGYKNKNDQWINMDFNEGYYGFAMPYNDVTVTITWGRVDGTSEEIETEKANALKILKAEYTKYKDNENYSTTIKAAYDKGRSRDQCGHKCCRDPLRACSRRQGNDEGCGWRGQLAGHGDRWLGRGRSVRRWQSRRHRHRHHREQHLRWLDTQRSQRSGSREILLQ